MRLTFLGTGNARPLPDTAASGILVEAGGGAVLFDIGSGIASQLETLMPADRLAALVIGHLHADHWIDIAPMRYRFPWAERADPRLPVFVPPGARDRLDHLATAISERAGLFDDAFEVVEYATGTSFRAGALDVTPVPVGHYVPAWSMDIRGPSGERVVYAGDMGPADSVVELARGADLLILEATLETPTGDDPKRGHLTTDEAIDHALRADVPRALLVHYPSERRALIAARCRERTGDLVAPALPGQVVELGGRASSG